MMNRIVVYLTHPYVDAWNFKPEHREILQEAAPGLDVDVCYSSGEFLELLPEAEAVVVWYFKKDWLAKAPMLRLIATPAAGRDWIDVQESETLTISHGGFHGPMMAESVVGAVFYFLKAFKQSAAFQKQRKWAVKKISDQLGSLYQAQVTILGFGRIGQTLGRALKPFGCRIAGIKRTPIVPPDYFTEGDEIFTDPDITDVLRETQHLVIVLPGGAETDGLLTREHFRALSDTAYLYNVGRGNPYKEDDLVAALKNGELAGAYLDVFNHEPLPETSQLWERDNVLIQPHLSAASPQYLELFARELGAKIASGKL